MFWDFVERARLALSHLQPLDWVLWIGLMGLTVALGVLAWTRWGQSKPLQKCFVLSLLAHLLIATYATSVKIVTSGPPPKEKVFQLAVVDTGEPDSVAESGATRSQSAASQQPWNALDTGELPETKVDAPAPSEVEAQSEPVAAPIEIGPSTTTPQPAAEPSAPLPVAKPQVDSVAPTAPANETPAAPSAAPATIELGGAPQAQPAPETPLPDAVSPLPKNETARDSAEPSRSAEPIGGIPDALETEFAPHLKLPDLPDTLRSSDDAYGAPDGGAAALNGIGEGRLAPIGGSGVPAATLALPAGTPSPASLAPTAPSGVPAPYRLRMAPDRAAAAARQGATAQSEAAVEAALAWLAKAQEPDGHWDPLRFGGNVERNVLGQARANAGAHAETGITGLALLAFLGAGQTHRDGEHAATVKRGLDYLVRVQGANGNLGGQAAKYSFMYCHGMAGLALSEAYALTNDRELTGPITRALAFTLSMQHRSTGGWRYQLGDLGDTSQLGWQLMFLKSAEWGGFRVPQTARDGAARYLASVSSGRSGGLASYRPQERVSAAMTAEALACRLLLGYAPTDPACREASEFVLTSLPGAGPDNFYYWYYATFALHHMQGDAWQRWNNQLQGRLVSTQLTTGPEAGSWDTICLWGGYGGRVYTTAMATLSLEVYYRYLPLLQERAADASRAAPR